MTKICLTALDYETVDNEPIIHLFGRNEQNERKTLKIKGFKPYFYIKEDDLGRVDALPFLRYAGTLPDFTRSMMLAKLVTQIPFQVRLAKEWMEPRGIRTWEAKILFPLRFMIDSGIYYGIDTETRKPVDVNCRLRLCFLDIETWSKRFPDPKKAKDPIVCMSLWDNYTDEYTVLYWGNELKLEPDGKNKVLLVRLESEQAMLLYFISYIKTMDPDVISAWNLDGFDLPYLYYRCRRLKLDIDDISPMHDITIQSTSSPIKGRNAIDLERAYRYLQTSELAIRGPNALGFVAERLKLPIQKVEIENFHEAWNHTPEKVLERNLKDVQIMALIERQVGIIEGFFDDVRKVVGCRLIDIFFKSRMGLITVQRECFGRVGIPTPLEKERFEYEGAVVISPVPSKYQNVIILDFKRMYPSIIESFNISPDTFDPVGGDIQIYANHSFTSTRKGMVPTIITRLQATRDSLQAQRKAAGDVGDESLAKSLDNKQEVVKYMINSFYGLMGYRDSPLFSPMAVESVTYVGRNILLWCSNWLKEHGYKVIYGDTDSLFVQARESDSITEGKKLTEMVNEAVKDYKLGNINPRIKVELKAVLGTLLLVKKKNYAGRPIWMDGKQEEYIYKGLSVVRSDTSDFTRYTLENYLESRLNEEPLSQSIEPIKEALNKLKSGLVPITEAGIPSSLGKPLDKYAVNAIQKKAAEYSNKNLGTRYGEGDKPKRLYVKQVPDGMPPTNVIAFETDRDLPGFVIDWDKMAEVSLKTKIKPIMALEGYSWDLIDPTKVVKKPKGGRKKVRCSQSTLSASLRV